MTTAAIDFVLPENPSLFTRLGLALRALNHLKDDPTHPAAGQAVNASLDYAIYAKLARGLRQTGEGRSLLEERPSLQGTELDLAALEQLPAGTLGHEFAAYFRTNGISPFVSPYEIRSDLDFISKRYRETHDIYHVLTGYRTDVEGEMELQAFAMGNLGIRSALLIVVVGALSMLAERRMPLTGIGSYVRGLRAAYRRGKRARSFLPFRFENHWDTPVETLRAELLEAPTAV